jgi:hypothetical protein
MRVDAETLTVIPAITTLVFSIFLIFYSLQFHDLSIRNSVFTFALLLFYVGIFLSICWAVYLGLHKKIPC